MNNSYMIKDIEKHTNYLLLSIVFLTISFSLYVDSYGRDFLSFTLIFLLFVNLYIIAKMLMKRSKLLSEQKTNREG